MKPKIAIIYYSATGNVHQLATAVANGATAAGAEVRLRRVTELFPDAAIAQNEKWQKHVQETKDIAEATIEDLAWADAFAFGTPSRYGAPAAQLKFFIDKTMRVWQEGKLANKPVTVFASAHNRHGGNEATILSLNNVFYHWGALIVPQGYTDKKVYAAGGNPYGATYIGGTDGDTIDDASLKAAEYQGERLATITAQLLAGRATLAQS